jgi:hypothetical protein
VVFGLYIKILCAFASFVNTFFRKKQNFICAVLLKFLFIPFKIFSGILLCGQAFQEPPVSAVRKRKIKKPSSALDIAAGIFYNIV